MHRNRNQDRSSFNSWQNSQARQSLQRFESEIKQKSTMVPLKDKAVSAYDSLEIIRKHELEKPRLKFVHITKRKPNIAVKLNGNSNSAERQAMFSTIKADLQRSGKKKEIGIQSSDPLQVTANDIETIEFSDEED